MLLEARANQDKVALEDSHLGVMMGFYIPGIRETVPIYPTHKPDSI